MKYLVIVPFVEDMGSIQPFAVRATPTESKTAAALWQVNSMRAHDNLPAMVQLPTGTKFRFRCY